MAYEDKVIDITAEELEVGIKHDIPYLREKQEYQDNIPVSFDAKLDNNICKVNCLFAGGGSNELELDLGLQKSASFGDLTDATKNEVVFVRLEDTQEIQLETYQSGGSVPAFRDIYIPVALYWTRNSEIVGFCGYEQEEIYIQSLGEETTTEYANALRGIGTGTALLFEDVSPIPHKVRISGTEGTKVYVSGKNLYKNTSLPKANESIEQNGVTFTGNADGTITLNGTSTTNFSFKDTTEQVFLSVGKYCGKLANSMTNSHNLGWQDASYSNKMVVNGGSRSVASISASGKMKLSTLFIYTNKTFNNFVIYPYAQLDVADKSNKNVQFEEYKGQTEYVIGENGFVEVDCIAPNMTVLADNEVTVEYNKDININKPLKDKKVMFFGDSITANNTMYRSDLLDMGKMKQIVSFAVGGATWRNSTSTELDGNPTNSSNNTMCNQVQKLLNNSANYETPDIIIMSASTNDGYMDSTTLETQFTTGGAYIDIDTCDLTSFAGAIRWCVEKLYSLYPNAVIFIATNIQGAEGTRPYNQQKEKSTIITKIANRLSIPVIDAFNQSGIYGRYETNGANGKYLADGLHPNENGAEKLAKCYYSALLNYFM